MFSMSIGTEHGFKMLPHCCNIEEHVEHKICKTLNRWIGPLASTTSIRKLVALSRSRAMWMVTLPRLHSLLWQSTLQWWKRVFWWSGEFQSMYNRKASSSSIEDTWHQHEWRPHHIHCNFGIKIEIPDFEGHLQPDEIIDWLHTVEWVFKLNEVSDDWCIKLNKYASLWWKKSEAMTWAWGMWQDPNMGQDVLRTQMWVPTLIFLQ